MSSAIAESISVVFTGIRNAGKSSLLNHLFEQSISIVSDTPGTTTDPVTRKMELKDLGPLSVTDTAGIDDVGELGEKRVEKTLSRIQDAQVVIFVTPANQILLKREKEFLEKIKKTSAQIIVAFTFADQPVKEEKINSLRSLPHAFIDNINNKGTLSLKRIMQNLKESIQIEMTPLEGIVSEGQTIVLVTPIDLAAPKGRLIMPQVETIRDALDRDLTVIITKERELLETMDKLKKLPDLVITDSQAFHKVSADIPPSVPLTSFSILFARKKGDLNIFLKGLKKIKDLTVKPKILVMEACSHHRQADDIGTVKIPRLFRQIIDADAEFEFCRELPENIALDNYDMVIHCGACMLNRQKMVNRMNIIDEKNVPIINYGLFLGFANGLIPRALQPIPEAQSFFL